MLVLGGRGGGGRDVAAHAFGGRLGARGGGGLQGGEGAGRNDAVEGRAQRGGGGRRGDDGRHGPGTKGEERARRARALARSLARGGLPSGGSGGRCLGAEGREMAWRSVCRRQPVPALPVVDSRERTIDRTPQPHQNEERVRCAKTKPAADRAVVTRERERGREGEGEEDEGVESIDSGHPLSHHETRSPSRRSPPPPKRDVSLICIGRFQYGTEAGALRRCETPHSRGGALRLAKSDAHLSRKQLQAYQVSRWCAGDRSGLLENDDVVVSNICLVCLLLSLLSVLPSMRPCPPPSPPQRPSEPFMRTPVGSGGVCACGLASAFHLATPSCDADAHFSTANQPARSSRALQLA